MKFHIRNTDTQKRTTICIDGYLFDLWVIRNRDDIPLGKEKKHFGYWLQHQSTARKIFSKDNKNKNLSMLLKRLVVLDFTLPFVKQEYIINHYPEYLNG